MLKLKKHEKEAIKHAQEKTRETKKADENVACPFIHTIDILKEKQIENVSHEICTICHKWMKTDHTVYSHPCNYLHIYEVKRRFWKDVDNEYLIST